MLNAGNIIFTLNVVVEADTDVVVDSESSFDEMLLNVSEPSPQQWIWN